MGDPNCRGNVVTMIELSLAKLSNRSTLPTIQRGSSCTGSVEGPARQLESECFSESSRWNKSFWLSRWCVSLDFDEGEKEAAECLQGRLNLCRARSRLQVRNSSTRQRLKLQVPLFYRRYYISGRSMS